MGDYNYKPLQEVARRRLFQWFRQTPPGGTTRRPGSLARDVIHGLVEGHSRCMRVRKANDADVRDWDTTCVRG